MLTAENGVRDQRWDEVLGISRGNRDNYKHWVAKSGTLIAELLTIAGTDHVITMDLHVYPSLSQTDLLGCAVPGIFQYSRG